jgi:hypothetical protein
MFKMILTMKSSYFPNMIMCVVFATQTTHMVFR